MQRKVALVLVIISLFWTGLAVSGADIVLTTTGHEITGTVSGIGAVVRLDIVPAAGPVSVFDIPKSEIRQITIDFPRVIVETANKVYIGPFASFTGIEEEISVSSASGSIRIPFSGLRAIALNETALHPVPREWLGDRFLLEPKVIAAPVVQGATPVPAAVTAPTTEREHPINWSAINPTPAIPPAESSSTPWWVGLLVVAGLAGLIYLSLGAATSS